MMTAEERVKAVWPEATVMVSGTGERSIWTTNHWNTAKPLNIKTIPARVQPNFFLDESSAWEDAASRLPVAPEPQGKPQWAENQRIWLIYYHDVDRKPELFAFEGAEQAARETYQRRKDNWTCHLLTDANPALQPPSPVAGAQPNAITPRVVQHLVTEQWWVLHPTADLTEEPAGPYDTQEEANAHPAMKARQPSQVASEMKGSDILAWRLGKAVVVARNLPEPEAAAVVMASRGLDYDSAHIWQQPSSPPPAREPETVVMPSLPSLHDALGNPPNWSLVEELAKHLGYSKREELFQHIAAGGHAGLALRYAAALRSEAEGRRVAEERTERLEVQLAGCGVAATGWSQGKQRAEQGAYGWSPAYADVLKLREHSWRCFHCDFFTLDEKEAAAHFGDRDDAEEFKPLCKWWQRMDNGEQASTLQDTIRQLNAEREMNAVDADEMHSLRNRAETAERERGAAREEVRTLREKLEISEGFLRELLGNETERGYLPEHNPQHPDAPVEECPEGWEYECGQCEFKHRVLAALSPSGKEPGK